MRRKPGALVPLELDILAIAAAHASDDTAEFHGFELARLLADRDGSRRLTGHGTLYKALGRLAQGGLLTAEWEDADLALAAGRPRRRLYTITAQGRRAHAEASAEAGQSRSPVRRLGIEPA